MLKKIHLNAVTPLDSIHRLKSKNYMQKNFGPCETTSLGGGGGYKPAMSSEVTLLKLLCSEKQFQIAIRVHPPVLMLEN